MVEGGGFGGVEVVAVDGREDVVDVHFFFSVFLLFALASAKEKAIGSWFEKRTGNGGLYMTCVRRVVKVVWCFGSIK